MNSRFLWIQHLKELEFEMDNMLSQKRFHRKILLSSLASINVFVSVIGWMAVVFGINSASVVNRKE